MVEGDKQFNLEPRPVLNRNAFLQNKKFETISWQIEAGHMISLAVLKHLKDSMQITKEQFDILLDKRVAWLRSAEEKARLSNDDKKLAEISAEMAEFVS